MIKVFPSILAADFSKLGDEVRSLRNSGADGVHIDIMDGVFVDNISFGMPVVRDIRKCSGLFFDVHLMITNPDKYIKAFSDAGADGITFHIEASKNPLETISLIRDQGKKVGISIRPETEIPDINILMNIDTLLVMSVNPGFGGQKYIESVSKKIEQISKIRYENDLSFEIEVDGGINKDNISNVRKLGADIAVIGNAIFSETDRKNIISEFKNISSR